MQVAFAIDNTYTDIWGARSDERRFRAKLAKDAKNGVKRVGLLASDEASMGCPGMGQGQATGLRAHPVARCAGGRGRVRRWGGSAGVARGCSRRGSGSAGSPGSFWPGGEGVLFGWG